MAKGLGGIIGLVVVSWCAACIGSPPALPALPAQTSGDSQTGGDDQASTTASDPAALLNEEVLVRWFIDESASGQGMGTVLGHDGYAFDLELIDDQGSPVFVEPEAGQRGLLFEQVVSAARLEGVLANTELNEDLAGRQALTIELVLQTDPLDEPRVSTFLYLGRDNQSGTLIGTSMDGVVQVVQLVDAVASATVTSVRTVGPGQRYVLHVAFDLGGPEPLVFYVNGTRENAIVDPGIAQDTKLPPPPTSRIIVGNCWQGGRANIGVIHYAALYGVAFDDAQAAHNAAALLLSDDQP